MEYHDQWLLETARARLWALHCECGRYRDADIPVERGEVLRVLHARGLEVQPVIDGHFWDVLPTHTQEEMT
jgi:hypothetical protein